ncbi:MAG: 7,8-didemethyl-8-hydroxy-5-deazariboflavin synthase subunit CofG, partial [Candidatus Hydrothermarchaeales archaeon]
FIPLTNACRNRCAYCGFRSDEPQIMEREEVRGLLKSGKEHSCKEALFTFGERPEAYPEIKEKLEDWGYSTVIDYLYDLCLDAIELGLLPHSNPGSISRSQLKTLKEVNASMGLMLESASERLCQKGMPHEKSPGKAPKVRLKVLKEAGRLEIPFTTGLLIGIGETDDEIKDALYSIRKIHDRYGHIQELIIQNFRPKPDTLMANHPEPPLSRIISALKVAKELFPDEGLQVPPNLNPGREGVFLLNGANDFGGISSVTPDFVNPQDKWPSEEHLRNVAHKCGFVLRERLPVYPRFIELVPERLKGIVDTYVDKDGLVNASG